MPRMRVLNMFVLIHDTAPNGGPTALVPGSHRLRQDPIVATKRTWQSSLTLDADLPQEAMPNHVKCYGRAGTAYIFDSACWHTPMPNTSGDPRRCFRMGWRSTLLGGNSGSSPLTEERVARLEASGRMKPALRQMLGLVEPESRYPTTDRMVKKKG